MVSPYPSALETLYPLGSWVTSLALVIRVLLLLDNPRGSGWVVVEIAHGGKSGQMKNFVGLGCL